MKQIFLLLFFVFVISGFENSFMLAQIERNEVLFVELLIPDRPNGKVRQPPHKFEIPNDYDFEKSIIGGGFATVDCINCVLVSKYDFIVYEAKKIKNVQTKIGFDLSFENKPSCNSKKEIKINRNKKETVKLKCGVKVV